VSKELDLVEKMVERLSLFLLEDRDADLLEAGRGVEGDEAPPRAASCSRAKLRGQGDTHEDDDRVGSFKQGDASPR